MQIFRRRRLRAAVRYDPRGFLVVAVTNRGHELPAAQLELRIPQEEEGRWLARIDEGGNPAMESGSFAVDGAQPQAGRPSLRWREELALPGLGATTRLRFFVGAVTSRSALPVELELTAPGLEMPLRLATCVRRDSS